LPKAESKFEQDVMSALADENFEVISQFPCCGYFIDIVAKSGSNRVAIECDGEFWHLDEHGELKIEDIGRQEVLERAGWRVLRIPYRSWREDSSLQVARIVAELRSNGDSETEDSVLGMSIVSNGDGEKTIAVDRYEKAIIDALREGARSRPNVYRMARETLGYGSLGSVIRTMLDNAVARLEKKEVVALEEDEIFFKNQHMRDSTYHEVLPTPLRPEKPRKKKSYRRWHHTRR
jgi:very-short-patch-repair endonuclease